MDAEALERRLDLLQHRRDGIAVDARRAPRCTRPGSRPRAARGPRRIGLDRRAEELHLAAGVVVVVLALDLVPGEREQPRDRVAVGAVARRRDDDRPRRVGGDHLHLDPLALLAPGRRRTRAGREDLRQRVAVPGPLEPEVDESRPRDLGALDLRQRHGPFRQLLRQLARRPPAARARAGARRSSRSRRARRSRAARARRAFRPGRTSAASSRGERPSRQRPRRA